MADKEAPQTNGGIVKRRNRIPVSCESCRTRKLKCDRQKPACQNCTARNMQTSCHYASHDGRPGGKTGGGTHLADGLDEVGDRLHRLEALVSSMVKAESSPTASTAATSGVAPPARMQEDGAQGYPAVESAMESNNPYGTMLSASGGPQFVGGSNWQAIVTDIAAIREHLEDTRLSRQQVTDDSDQPAILGGVLRSVTRAELLTSLPAKLLADRLITRFFDIYDPSLPYSQLIHRATFVRHYERFWSNFDSWPLAKVGMLFSMFHLALASYQRYGDEPPDLQGQIGPMTDAYRHQAAQCILAAKLGAPTFDSVVALMLHGMSEYARLPYSESTHWMLHGLLVRHAMRAGFHRDPSEFPSIPPFEGEQRRRIWHSICQLDLLLSLQLGMPAMTRYSETNVAPPRSVYEEELYEGMAELPPARSPSEPTQVAYGITKQRIFQVIGRVVQHLNSARPPSDDEVLELNQELCDIVANMPGHLRHRPWENSINDAVPLRLQRMQLQIFYDKALCILNRGFLAVPRSRGRFVHSRGLCVQAALGLLSIQTDMNRMGVKWYLYTLNRNDFLLATAILCRALHSARSTHGEPVDAPKRRAPSAPTGEEDAQIHESLRSARAIWAQISDVAPDARPAVRIIDAMLEKVPSGKTDASPVPSLESAGRGGAESGGTPPSIHAPTPDDVPPPEMMDWSQWDSFIRGSGLDAFDSLDQLWTMPT